MSTGGIDMDVFVAVGVVQGGSDGCAPKGSGEVLVSA